MVVGFVWSLGWVAWELTDSQSGRDCIHDRKTHQTYEALHEDTGFVAKELVRVRLNVACGFVAADNNEGALTGISGIAVALFTLALWLLQRNYGKRGMMPWK